MRAVKSTPKPKLPGAKDALGEAFRGGHEFGDNVLLFEPGMDMRAIQRTLDALHTQQALAEFSDKRYALLFKPGVYDLNVTVDFYVQASGLGRVPSQVQIRGTVQSTSTTTDNRVTLMFWRSAENFLVSPPDPAQPVVWAVSQAAPYRRMHIQGDLQLDRGGWASGGFLANSVVEGVAGLTTGQQWFTRNAELGSWRGGSWNRSFVGTRGTPAERWPDAPVTIIARTPIIRDKPFLMVDERGAFGVFVPALARLTRGVSWETSPEPGVRLPLQDFYLAHPDTDSAATLNAALDAGQHLLFTPGIYALEGPVRVCRPGDDPTSLHDVSGGWGEPGPRRGLPRHSQPRRHRGPRLVVAGRSRRRGGLGHQPGGPRADRARRRRHHLWPVQRALPGPPDGVEWGARSGLLLPVRDAL